MRVILPLTLSFLLWRLGSCCTNDIDLLSGNTVTLTKSSQGELCTLVKVASDGQSIAPVGRSYENGDWERVAGPFEDLVYTCSTDCTVTLPPLETGETFLLKAFTYSLSKKNEIARFLEQATFGTTRADLEQFDIDGTTPVMDEIKDWIYEQIYSINATSQRAFFRSRVNNRYKPSHAGRPYHACEEGTRYRKAAFSSLNYKNWVKLNEVGPNIITLSVEDNLYTVVESINWSDETFIESHGNLKYTENAVYEICSYFRHYIGGVFSLRHKETNSCRSVIINGVYGVPPISFPVDGSILPTKILRLADSASLLAPINEQFFPDNIDPSTPNNYGSEQEFQLLTALDDILCVDIAAEYDGIPVFIYREDVGDYLVHDPPPKLLKNTLEEPALDGGGEAIGYSKGYQRSDFSQARCANVPRTFQNEAYCQLSTDPLACGQEVTPTIEVTLNAQTLQAIYDVTSQEGDTTETRYVYAIDNLRIDENSKTLSPCQAIVQSRWIPLEAGSVCTNDLQGSSVTHIAGLLAASTDANPYIRDVINENSNGCHVNDRTKTGFDIEVEIEGVVTCYRHVHQDHLQVFDFTYWTYPTTHPGNAGNPDAIKQFAQGNEFKLQFPGWHGMDRWITKKGFFTELGRFGDAILYNQLPSTLRSDALVLAFNGTAQDINGAGVIVCGSPGEVGNDISLGGGNRYGGFDLVTYGNRTVNGGDPLKAKESTWIMIGLHARDQLRQKVAWTLSKIITFAADNVGHQKNSDMILSFYDIFVRNAFGSYFDILKESAYHIIMATSLTYVNSRSTYNIWRYHGTVSYPDENFAREVMQLYSIGLCKLNIDGSVVMNENGDSCEHTYSNDDIVEYARVWTGFIRRDLRGNIGTEATQGYVDPLHLRDDWRDLFPKMGLNGLYIGERYPVCADRPKKHFLKKGAKYILLGSVPFAEQHNVPDDWATSPDAINVQLERPNAFWARDHEFLHTHLCNANENSTCEFSPVVILPFNLKCLGIECKLDTVRVVEVEGMFYEYIETPCVEKAFFVNPVLTSGRHFGHNRVCADRRREVASNACCENPDSTFSHARHTDLYWGERITYATAVKRCNEIDQPVCPVGYVHSRSCTDENGDFKLACRHYGHYWQKAPCQLKVKVDAVSGKVAIVHGHDLDDSRSERWVQEESITYFRVHWKDGKYPKPQNFCGGSRRCSIYQGDLCLCEVGVRETRAFSSMPLREEALARLHFGAYSPEILKYHKIEEVNGVSLYAKSKLNSFHRTSIFELEDEYGVKKFLQNVKSIVIVKGGRRRNRFSFRNPVHFTSLSVHDQRDMNYETHAALEQYFYHSNTAPFISKYLIKHLGVSNPSPSYVKDVALTFTSGLYTDGSHEFGSGKYGDLGATVAAILLHKEARSVVLDRDASHGFFQETIMKLMRFLRTMEVTPFPERPLIELHDTQNKIGQLMFDMPSVFSFYLPDFKPSGRVALAGLLAPEAQLNTGPSVIGLMNAFFSAIKYGLTYMWDGVFQGKGGSWRRLPGEYLWATGYLAYQPSTTDTEFVIDELNTLLTSGRLQDEKKEIISNVYENEPNKTQALMMAQQLFVSTPEFHTTGLTQLDGTARPKFEDPVQSAEPYKAVVFILLSGGLDSHNMLVPQCEPLKSQYENKRREFALSGNQLLPISLSEPHDQPCDDFGIHFSLTDVHQSFQDEKTLFVANIGVLNTAVDKTNYNARTKTILFGHNTMQEETQRIDPYITAPTTGVLGRLIDELNGAANAQGDKYKTSAISVRQNSVVLNGAVGVSAPPVVVKRDGKLSFDPYPWNEFSPWKESDFDLLAYIQNLNNVTTLDSSMFGETWSADLLRVIDESKLLGEAIDAATLSETFPTSDYGRKMAQVARLINTTDMRGVDREVFFVNLGGWDHHAELAENLQEKFEYLNEALKAFWDEMRAQGNEDKVAVVQTSEFARTLTPNSGEGSDHAWAGQIFMSGGKVNGGRILGQYPDDLDGELNIDGSSGRGRLIPTTSYDALFNGISEWMGIEDEEALNRILPNRLTCGSDLFSKEDLFVE